MKHKKINHATFHQSFVVIVESTQEGKIEQAKKMLGGDFYKASNKTIESIHDM